MPQFLLSPADVAGGKFVLRGPEAFHVTRVLRLRQGDPIDLFDGKGLRYRGVIEDIQPDGTISGSVEGTRPGAGTVAARLTLYLGLLKASHWEWALEKGTELGVAAFVPVVTPRTVVRLREEATAAKTERWRKILIAASKQCGRTDIPELKAPAHFRDAIAAAGKQGLTLLAWEKKASSSTYAGLRETLREARSRGSGTLAVNLFIGPEGGFSEEEVELAECDGAALFGLGPNILRAETAALAAVAVILHELREA